MKRNHPYPLALPMFLIARGGLAAYWTGEYRPARPGEWYLSGAIIEAHHAANGTIDSFHIAAIHRVRKVETIVRGPAVIVDNRLREKEMT